MSIYCVFATNTSSWTTRVSCLSSALLYFVVFFFVFFLPHGLWKNNKNLSAGRRLQQSDLPFEETARCLRRARRQVESQFCLLVSRWSLTPFWTIFELPWQLLWYRGTPPPPPPPSRTFCHASQSGRLLKETVFLYATWQRAGGICWLESHFWILRLEIHADRNYTEHWGSSCLLEGFECQ